MNKGLAISVFAITLLSISTVVLIDSTAFVVAPVVTQEVKDPGNDGVGVTGWVHIEVYDKEGNTKYVNDDHNLVVTKGLESLSDLAFGTAHTTGESVGGFTHIQLGTGTVDPAVGDTNCGTPSGNKIDDTSVTDITTGVYLNATFTLIPDGASISEICLTDSNTNATGNLFSRQEFTPFTFNSGDSVNATWSITFADSDGT